MKLREMILFLFVLLVIPVAAPAQDSKQALNDQLWEAARSGNAAAVTALLDKGADVNAKFRYGARHGATATTIHESHEPTRNVLGVFSCSWWIGTFGEPTLTKQ